MNSLEQLAANNEHILNFFQTGSVQRAAIEEFARAIINGCLTAARTEIVSQTNIDDTTNPQLKSYLNGNNGGIIDAVYAIKYHFGMIKDE